MNNIIDWFYGQIIGFLGNFFAEMGNMGTELFDLDWVQAIVLFFSQLGWALFGVSLVVCIFECGIEYSTGRANIQQTAINILKGFLSVCLFTTVPVRLYTLSVSLQGTFSAGLTGYGSSIGTIGEGILEDLSGVESITEMAGETLSFGLGVITSPIMGLSLRRTEGTIFVRDKGRGSHSPPRPADTAPQCGSGSDLAGIRFQPLGSRRGAYSVRSPQYQAFARFMAGISKNWRYFMPRNTIKFALRISPETQQLVKELCPRDNCQSQNEFIERAIRFYAGYVSGKEAIEYLPPALVAAMRGMIHDSEQHIASLLFKLAVEMDMVMNILAADRGLTAEDLRTLRGRCVQEVRETHGRISFQDALSYQKGGRKKA